VADELRPYDPSWRDRLRWGLEDLLSGIGSSRSVAQRYGDQIVGSPSSHGVAAADVVPYLSNALSANEAKRSYDSGDYLGAGLSAIGALPPLPFAKVGGLGDDGLRLVVGKPDANTVKLYHGTQPETIDEIIKSGLIKGDVFFTPKKSTAEEFGGALIEAYMPKSELGIDLDLPGAKILSLDDANRYANNRGWSIDDYLNSGKSVAYQGDILERK
jgi:hypothetical protein